MWYPLAAMRGVLEALHQGDYDTAMERLTRTALFGRKEEAREALLLLAEVHSLYGEEGLEKAHQALEEAYELGDLEYSPLYRALLAELLALEGRGEREVLPLFLPSEDPRARYHQAQALFYLGRFEEVLTTLRQGLPAFLAWRAEGLRGRALERLGRHAEAALAYERGAEDAATRHYLLARAHLLLDNPNRALEAVREALKWEEESGHKAYGTPLLEGQILLRLGRYPEAMAAFQEALNRAEGAERAYVLHEMGVAALDQGAYLEAEEHLKALLREEGYAYRAQALADLAEALYRQGRYGEAEEVAREAMALGAEAAGELILGHIAYDLMHLEEALGHYRKAADLAEEGSREWVGAQEMVVDTLAQLGYRSPEEILARAEAVLPHVHPADEWHEALSAYRERAAALLREGRRPN